MSAAISPESALESPIVIAAIGSVTIAATAQAAKLTTSGGMSRKRSRANIAPSAYASAAPIIASAPRNSPVLPTVSTPISSSTPAKPIKRPTFPRRSTRSLRSIAGASSAMNSGPGEISTPVRPESISVSPNAIREKGSATASVPWMKLSRRRRRSSPSAARSAPPRIKITAYRSAAASTTRRKTITAGSNPSNAILISR